MDYRIEKKAYIDIDGIKDIIEEILCHIRGIINENVFFNTKLILYELTINGILHGNHENVNKGICINLTINKSCIIIEVIDEGSGITYKHKSFGDYDLCESGRGLMLVEGLSDKFEIEGNRIKCVQYL
jgi:anti-sigma regulatory factor (Ser/Thr protein kinase)